MSQTKLPLAGHTEESKESHFPSWLHRSLPKGSSLMNTGKLLEKYRLNTVCEEARCPNRIECYSKQTATFLALGKQCSRSCGFCSIDFSKTPKAPEEDEPQRIALSAKELGLQHVVITMVARDDLEDQGASHLARIIQEVRKYNPQCTIEVLTSDFSGNFDAIDIVLKEKPEIFNHNIETVERLTPKVRHKAEYHKTLSILKYVSLSRRSRFVKSGLMLGLGEEPEEVLRTLQDLRDHGCSVVTMGQYLQPSKHTLKVKQFVSEEDFAMYARKGREMGIAHMYCAPLVRSSYNAKELWDQLVSSS